MPSSDGQTAFMVACSFKADQSIMAYLKYGGMDLEIKDKNNRTAADLCKYYRFYLGTSELAKITDKRVLPNAEQLALKNNENLLKDSEDAKKQAEAQPQQAVA